MAGQIKFQIKLLDKRGMPQRATPMSAGYDVVACIDETIVIRKGDKATLIPLGFACYMADGHVAGLILPRSGLGHKQGLVLGNTVGVVDGDYQNQWFASASNRGQQDEIIINPGDRLAQIVFVPVIHPDFDVVSEFHEVSERGLGGFGSTGVGEVKEVTLEVPRGSLGEVIEQ
jgi:dUTP pyrophosphatase